jgi:putative drug exporter of the RND superfamily
MLDRITTFTTRFPKPGIAFWLVLALALSSVSAGVGYKVMTDDTAQFLPKGSESAQALAYAQTAFGVQEGTRTVTMLVKRDDGKALTAADRAEVGRLAGAVAKWPSDSERAGRVVAAQAGPVAPDLRFQFVALQWKANATDPIAQEHFRDIRDRAADQVRAHGLSVGFTGGIATQADEVQATEDSAGTAQTLLFAAVILLSLLFFRGPLAALVPLVSILFVAAVASGLVVLAALALGFKLDTSTPQLITVVLVGIGVDYFLFLLFRLRERLRAGEDRRTAARNAAGAVSPVIASAALAVVAAFATMVLAEFGQFRMLGPAIAISVLVMLLAGVTLMPAIAAVTGRALFWPSRSWARERTNGPAARLGHHIARRPGRAALSVTAVLIVLATFAVGTTMSYDLGGGPSTPATRTADQITAALSDGATDPQYVYVKSPAGALTAAQLKPLRAALADVDGVTAVGRPGMTPDRHGARIDVVLADAPISKTAMETASGPLRDAAHTAAPRGTTTMVAGTSATFADVSDAIDRDMHVIFPVAALLILLILVITLRSVVAPLYLLAAVGLEFGATLGAATLVFQQLGGASGIGFILPLVLFLFVVALGTDYNILISARLKEEMLTGAPVREAVARAVRHVAPAIGAAGLVLATSFATLMLESDEATQQQGFAMAFGILMASLLVATTLVPALTALVGGRAWRKPAA